MQKPWSSWSDTIAFLKEQANAAYVWNEDLGYWQVKERWHYWGHPEPVITMPVRHLRDAFEQADLWHKNHPSLSGNFMMRAWPALSERVQKDIAYFFEAEGQLQNFDFLDHGGRAMVFTAKDRQTGRTRVARMETNHDGRTPRLKHSTVLQPYLSNEGDMWWCNDIKLEILPEIVPLHKIPGRRELCAQDEHAYHQMTYWLSHGTNWMYDWEMYDYDADVTNVGLLPGGKIVSLDPQYLFNAAAKAPRTLFYQSPEARALYPHAPGLYGLPSNDLYF